MDMVNEMMDRMVGQRQHVGYPDICQYNDRGSRKIHGKNVIPNTPMNLEYCDVVSNSKNGVVVAFPLREEIETTFKLDSEVIESELAFMKSSHNIEPSVLKYNVLFEDILIYNECSGANGVDSIACLRGYSLYDNPLWFGNMPPKYGNILLEDKSILIGKECIVWKMTSSFTLYGVIIESIHGDGWKTSSKYTHEGTIVEVDFTTTYL